MTWPDGVVHNDPYEYPNDRKWVPPVMAGLAFGGLLTALFCAWLYVST